MRKTPETYAGLHVLQSLGTWLCARANNMGQAKTRMSTSGLSCKHEKPEHQQKQHEDQELR